MAILEADIGQLGSQDWPQWASVGESDPDDDRLSEDDLKRLLHPFCGHHVLISAEAFEVELAKQKAQSAEIQAAAEHAPTERQVRRRLQAKRSRAAVLPSYLKHLRSIRRSFRTGTMVELLAS